MAVQRRELTFASFDEVLADAENLLVRGYEKAGNWDLAQVSNHLSEWLRYQLDGYPRAPLLARPLFWMYRNTLGKSVARKMMAGGKIQEGIPTIPQSVSAPGGDDAAAVAKLREMMARWQAHTGPLQASPLFGRLTRDEWIQVQLIHCAHHLSFLVPRT